MRTKMLLSASAFVLVLTLSVGGRSLLTRALTAEQEVADGPQFTKDNQLLRPTNYRTWVYLSSSVGLQYGPNAPANPSFENVYVNPAAYKKFAETGQWPDKTIFILEIRRLMDKGTFAQGGQYQGDLITMEAAVKDESRFPEKWAYFGLGTTAQSAKAIPKDGGCFSCHSKNGAVENTFAQFYPTALSIAKEKGTLNPSYLRTLETR